MTEILRQPDSGQALPGSGPDSVPLDCSPTIRAASDYWQSIRPEYGLPGRQHLKPAAIPALLANIRLVEVVGDPARFKTRLVGSVLVEFFGRDYTGEWHDETFPGFRESASQRDYLDVIATKQPRWKIGTPYQTRNKDHYKSERVLLPLARDGENVDMILCVYEFHRA